MNGNLLVGCCGFPLSLARYAETFPVVEVQQTFYQPPMLETLAKWRAQVPAEFEFTLKAWQLITHEASSPTYRRLREKLSDPQKKEAGGFRLSDTVMMAWERTLECARVLGSRVILFQCPARFAPSPENKASLRAFFREIRRPLGSATGDPPFTFAWEPRGDWETNEIRELCEELNLIHALDPLRQEGAIPGHAYFRLHGLTGYRYDYTDQDLARLLRLVRQRAFSYVLFNNISMLDDARRFQERALRA
jgi:uncharacterized protein YecE (DUF72 family)